MMQKTNTERFQNFVTVKYNFSINLNTECFEIL